MNDPTIKNRMCVDALYNNIQAGENMKKRILSIILAAALIISLCAFTATADSKPVLYGDTDGDGEINIIDATLIQRHLIGLITLDEAALRRAAVSGDDELSIADATLIQRYDVKLISAFPVEEQDKPKVKDVITIHFTNNKKWSSVNAYFYNKATGAELKEWPGVALSDYTTNEKGEQVYSSEVDVTKYDRVIFNSGSKQTTEIPVTKASSGFGIQGRVGKKYYAYVYPYEKAGDGKVKTVVMDYPDGYKKKVYIWTPEGYDPNDTSKKYSVLYMCDGQNLFGNVPNLSGFYWQCQDTVNSLMSNGGDGVIIVGIDNNDDMRVTELTPDLIPLDPEAYAGHYAGGYEYPEFRGKVYSDFIADTLIPYIDTNYNTNSIRGIAGSSCGGQAAFYIGLENPDKFSYIGAFSSAFAYFPPEIWDKYLSSKDFSGDVPYIYLYTGMNKDDNTEQWIYPTAIMMDGWLADHDYPADKRVNIIDADARHHESFWALYLPELICKGLEL